VPILLEEQVVGWSYKGEEYYNGLLLKYFHHDCLESVTCPHISDLGGIYHFSRKLRLHFPCSSYT